MQTIGIITHYDVHNHGALLQLNALIHVLRDEGHTAEALLFDKNYDFLGSNMKHKYEFSLKSVPIYTKYLLNNGLKRTVFNYVKKKVLDNFKANMGLLGSYYTDVNGLDTIIIGSDEVFALHTGPTTVFWGYGLPSDNIISYAASFGPTTYEDVQLRKCLSFVKAGLENLSSISVRDDNSLEIVKKLISGREVVKVCDPVILYGYIHELKTLPKVVEKPYVLVYSYDNNMNEPTEIDQIKAFAKSNDLRIISAGFYHKWCDKNINTDPVSLLAYFRDAKFVITDTFHGAVMSIITNKQLAVKMRNNTNKLNNLLSEYGLLSQRLDSSLNNLEGLYRTKISWDRVNEEVSKRRCLSRKFLLNSLK